MSEQGLAIPSHPLERDHGPTWREKARRAGMGTRAAMKKAIMLLTEVRATLVPVRFRHSPVRSCRNRKGVIRGTMGRQEEADKPLGSAQCSP